jgi:two-component system sensor histidine kinase KdpD
MADLPSNGSVPLPVIRRFLPARYRARWADFFKALGSVALATVVLLALRSNLSTQVIALLYLLPVMLSAARWGLLPALSASLTSFFAFNFFFLFPTLTLAVLIPEELLGLMVFLIVAVIIAQAVASANESARQAEAREREATTLYALSRALDEPGGPDGAFAAIPRIITGALPIAGCEVLTGADPQALQSQARYPAEPGAATRRWMDIPIAARQATVGVIRLYLQAAAPPLDSAALRLLTTFAAQAGLYIERANLVREVGRAQLLEESDRLKSALLSSVSHDLRTPLAAIKASATVLLEEGTALDDATRTDLLSAINEETDRLNRLVGDLLNQSRIEAGALRLKRDWCDMDELIRAVIRRLGPALAAFRVGLTLPPDLPLVLADYVEIDRVMSNLLENAVRFAPPGSSIEIAAFSAPEGLTVSVTNQGPAIPARRHPFLFDKFYRISEDRSPNMGTGLGLSICKGIVEAHGGRIWVESPVAGGTGTRFAFTLPRAEAAGRTEDRDAEENKNPDRG